MDVKSSLRFLFGAIREGVIQLRPLTHGYERVCYQMIDNNFSQYIRAIEQIKIDLQRHTDGVKRENNNWKYHAGMYDAAYRAFQDLELWYSLSISYYKGVDYVEHSRRILPSYRKIIQLCNANIQTGYKTENSRKEVKNRLQRGIKKHIQSGNRLRKRNKR